MQHPPQQIAIMTDDVGRTVALYKHAFRPVDDKAELVGTAIKLMAEPRCRL